LGIPLYARIAPELYLKRLVVGGFEKVYELNRNFATKAFRPAQSGIHHARVLLGYADVNQMMDLHEEMMRSVVKVATVT
jgi:lysyl-tRNA synthetase class 2